MWLPSWLENTIKYSLSASAWSNYKTAWKTFNVFLLLQGFDIDLPVPIGVLCRYVVYLYRVRMLTYGTIKNYMSGLKFIHGLACKSTEVFKHFWYLKTLKAVKNLELARLKEKPPTRCAFTYPVLQIFGDELLKDKKIHPWTKMNIWGAAVLAYFASLRLGDFLPTSHGLDEIRILSWDRIRVVDDDHLCFLIVLPKNTYKEQGVIRDIIRFRDRRYCPVYNLLRIFNCVRVQPGFKLSDPVFTKASGKHLYSRDINDALHYFLDPLFGKKFTGHSFRAAIASQMSENPEIFNEKQVEYAGDWHGGSQECYQRRHGVGIKKTKQLLNDLTY